MTNQNNYFETDFKPIRSDLHSDFNRLTEIIIKEYGSWKNYKKEMIEISNEFVKTFNAKDWYCIFGDDCNK